MVPWQGMYSSFLAAEYVVKNGIKGDIVECGVYRGGISALMAETVLYFDSDSKRIHWLFDTFEGMTEPAERDFKHGAAFNDTLKKYHSTLNSDGISEWCLGSEEDVALTMKISPIDKSNYKLVKGKVEDTLPAEGLGEISLLRLDTDWYESTKYELEKLYPNLQRGGVLLIDDYGSWNGAREAVNEYFENFTVNNPPMLVTDSYYGALIGVKP
jgi:hypothetical protein